VYGFVRKLERFVTNLFDQDEAQVI